MPVYFLCSNNLQNGVKLFLNSNSHFQQPTLFIKNKLKNGRNVFWNYKCKICTTQNWDNVFVFHPLLTIKIILKTPNHINRPISQWLYYGLWFSAFCVLHTLLLETLRRNWKENKEVGTISVEVRIQMKKTKIFMEFFYISFRK